MLLMAVVYVVVLLTNCFSKHQNFYRLATTKHKLLQKNGFSQSDYLRFWYYAGLIHTGMKHFALAIDAYEQCFSAPAMVLRLT
jgi:hypothetical protein